MTETVPSPSPHGHCIFCEDIRFEVNAKETYVGVFGSGELFVLGQLPTNIGKFAIKTYYSQRRADIATTLAIEILMPGDSDDGPTARVDIDLQEVLKNLPEPPINNDDPFLTIQSVFLFNPLEIKTQGLITVRAVRDGKNYRLGRLQVKVNPTAEAPAQPPPGEAAN